MTRPTRPNPRTFEHFPEDQVCPVCGTNDDGQTVLVPIAGTDTTKHIFQAQPMHLDCAVIQQWDEGMGFGYTWMGWIDDKPPSDAATGTPGGGKGQI